MANIFENYQRQNISNKELIIILNNNKLEINHYRSYAMQYNNISIYQLDEKKSLGACLNYGAAKAKYDIIAKFDDDDYYGPTYLKSSLREFEKENISIVGKRSYYVFLEQKNTLLLKAPHKVNKFVRQIAGPTLVFKKEVWQNVPFNNLKVGTDTNFIYRCRKAGYKIYSTNHHHFAHIRRKDRNSHTWKTTEKKLRKGAKKITFTGDFKKVVDNQP